MCGLVAFGDTGGDDGKLRPTIAHQAVSDGRRESWRPGLSGDPTNWYPFPRGIPYDNRIGPGEDSARVAEINRSRRTKFPPHRR